MIENISELQEFIEWCKVNGVRRVRLETVEFELSDIGLTAHLLEDNGSQGVQKDGESTSMTSKTMVDTADFSKEDEDMLFYSSGPVR